MSNFRRSLPLFLDYVLLIVGATIQAIGLRLFMVPANLANGGVTGISQLINHFTGWPIGLMVLIGNFPLFLLGGASSAGAALRCAQPLPCWSIRWSSTCCRVCKYSPGMGSRMIFFSIRFMALWSAG